MFCFSFAPEQTVWANHRDASDFRRHRAYYDVTVMTAYCEMCLTSVSQTFLRYVMALQWQHMWNMTSDISDNSTMCSPSCSGLQQRKHQSFASLALCEGNLPLTSGDLHHKGPVMQTAFLCHEVMMDVIPFWQVFFFPSASAKHDATCHLLVWHPRLKQRYNRKPLHWLL